MRRALFIAAFSGCLVGTVSLAQAADMATKAPMPAKAPMALPVALYNWNGFYVGGNFGYGWNDIDTTSTSVAGDQTTSSLTRRGVFGGGQIGYNWQFNPNWLVGLEGDIDAADIKGTLDACSDATHCAHSDGKNDWFATVRGRLGYVQNNWLIFATGGVVWLHGTNTRTITVAPANALVLVGQASTASGTDAGWTVGGGVEYGFARNWSLNVEYRYMQVDTSRDYSYSLIQANRHNDSTEHVNTVRVGVNFHFN